MKSRRLWIVGLLNTLMIGALLVGAVGCGDTSEPEPQAGPPPGATRLDDQRYLGAAMAVGNLRIWPVYADMVLDLGDFLTLEEAEKKGVARVREVGGQAAGTNGAQGGQVRVAQQGLANDNDLPFQTDVAPGQSEAQEERPAAPPPEQVDVAQQAEEIAQAAQGGQTLDTGDGPQQTAIIVTNGQQIAGLEDIAQQLAQVEGSSATVNTLVIENDSDLPILVVAGTIVKGGQQDRQIGQDFVIAANTKVPVEAFCVEPGRWQTRAGTDGVAFQNASLGLAVKNVRAKAQYAKDQGEVWEEVGKVLESRAIEGTTSFVAAVEEQDEEGQSRRAELEKAVLEHFKNLASSKHQPVGFAYAVNGKVQTVRAFAHPRLLDDHLPAFAKAMALEAELAKDGEKQDVSVEDVTKFVTVLAQAEESLHRTRAMNWNGIRESEGGYNGNCYIADPDDEDKKTVLTVDWTAK